MRLSHYCAEILWPVLSRGNNEFIHTRLQYKSISHSVIKSIGEDMGHLIAPLTY